MMWDYGPTGSLKFVGDGAGMQEAEEGGTVRPVN